MEEPNKKQRGAKGKRSKPTKSIKNGKELKRGSSYLFSSGLGLKRAAKGAGVVFKEVATIANTPLPENSPVCIVYRYTGLYTGTQPANQPNPSLGLAHRLAVSMAVPVQPSLRTEALSSRLELIEGENINPSSLWALFEASKRAFGAQLVGLEPSSRLDWNGSSSHLRVERNFLHLARRLVGTFVSTNKGLRGDLVGLALPKWDKSSL
uniref:Uncharacterized protein n=1 Tax=Ananas comosus var. bracteatus TaxID=296719 RepID=A0A6V7QBX5_ANACO|nr:unnamed protein product [Ananas comosus var. bracteatus]